MAAGDYREATLWPRGSEGVIFHATALDLYGLGDANLEKIHLTLPLAHRTRREVPGQYALHREDLAPEEVRLHEGIPGVMPAKAIRQSRKLGPELLRGASPEGERSEAAIGSDTRRRTTPDSHTGLDQVDR